MRDSRSLSQSNLIGVFLILGASALFFCAVFLVVIWKSQSRPMPQAQAEIPEPKRILKKEPAFLIAQKDNPIIPEFIPKETSIPIPATVTLEIKQPHKILTYQERFVQAGREFTLSVDDYCQALKVASSGEELLRPAKIVFRSASKIPGPTSDFPVLKNHYQKRTREEASEIMRIIRESDGMLVLIGNSYLDILRGSSLKVIESRNQAIKSYLEKEEGKTP